MIELAISSDMIWMVVVGFIIAFVLAFGIGANDVANSFGTSVGSKVLTLKHACILACVFETLGAILLGAKVSDTIRKGVIDVELYKNDTELLMTGSVAALAGSCCWLLAATLLRLPVSATHSIVGATIGFALVNHGLKGIQWSKLGLIIGSWFISPVLAGLVSTGIFYVLKFFILNKKDGLEPGLRFLPIFYAITIVINMFSVFYDGPEMLHFDKIPMWGTFILAFGSGTICAIVVRLCIVPWQRKRILAYVLKRGQQSDVKDADQDDENKSPASSASASLNNSRRNSACDEKDKEKLALEYSVQTPHNGAVARIQYDGANNYNDNNAEKNMNELNTVIKPEANNKLKINKSEDASLLQNEYNLGGNSPKKASGHGADGFNKNAANGAVPHSNGTVKPVGTDVRMILDKNEALEESLEEGQTEEFGRSLIKDRPETARLFSFLQILTAVFGAFAHGGNDVSNAIGPLVTLWLIAKDGFVEDKTMTPIWILMFGGVGISLGLCALGRRVIKTMGEDLTRITPSSGFCIEIGSALTVLIASNVGIPISTTHCKVGSVVFVGRFRSRENVDWRIFRNIVLAWLVTLPVTGGISAAIMAGLKLLVT